MTKMGVDIISQRKGVFRTVLSPHFKSGLVSRSISNVFGQIGSEYRVWRFMRELAQQERVVEDLLEDHWMMKTRPGVLDRKNLDSLAELVRGDVTMLLRFSPATASALEPRKYRIYEERYSGRTIRDSWRPWKPMPSNYWR